MQPTPITDTMSVVGQITLEDIAQAAKDGYGTIINNRPDGEEPGQLTHEQAAAEAARSTASVSTNTFRCKPTRSRGATWWRISTPCCAARRRC